MLRVTQPAAVSVDVVLAAVVGEHDRGAERQQLLEVPGGPFPEPSPALSGCGISGALIPTIRIYTSRPAAVVTSTVPPSTT